MKRILIVHNLLEGQKIVHELSDKDFAIELVEGDGVDEHTMSLRSSRSCFSNSTDPERLCQVWVRVHPSVPLADQQGSFPPVLLPGEMT